MQRQPEDRLWMLLGNFLDFNTALFRSNNKGGLYFTRDRIGNKNGFAESPAGGVCFVTTWLPMNFLAISAASCPELTK
jgi:hypothetical protein